MFSWLSGSNAASAEAMAAKEELLNLRGIVAAINRSQAVIEFGLDGTILTANDNFLKALGYSLDEIKGKHHSLFVDPAESSGAAYRAFWQKLGRGEFDAARYKRIGKGGREVWIQASYNPVFDAEGKPCKVIKFASDITAEMERQADLDGQIAAINKAQAVIQFSLDGKVLDANENFCNTLGYSLAEIKGQHHSLFVEGNYRNSPEYRQFWEKLGRGEFDSGQYLRIAKGGREVWIQATYNPILDASGRPFKVVKFAVDTTAQVRAAQALERAVEETQAVVQAAQHGDLKNLIRTDDKDGQILKLCQGVNAMLSSIADVISQIRTSADAVSVAAGEISQGNADLSSRTEEQASSIEETASTMEELTATVRHNSENAGRANKLASEAQLVAEKGGSVVTEVVATMSAIQQSSNRISDIIGVIDGIAFQTNILALNAAVEAARAGEQGRGFAVVATEVRNLAQRSASAAKEIKQLISDSSDKVRSGTQQVDVAGRTMEEVVTSIKRVAGLVNEISEASLEQASGIEQVSKAVAQMDEVTQQNAALVEEAAAAAESLNDQAGALVSVVSRYSTADNRQQARGAASKARPSLGAPAKRLPPAASAKPHKPAPVSLDDEWEEF
ncbi:MAG: putative methyl-accepting chemotaxis protein with multiple domain [Proteobacteria bacterium]|nr:putative methyl-accepting chemotaxis protein with multiple domain [Pseudomonadota bacterium]